MLVSSGISLTSSFPVQMSPDLMTHRVSTSTCGMKKGAVADCDREDMGSCGNACCTLEAATTLAPEGVYKSLVTFLKQGGDGAYKYVSGVMPFNEHPADDLRKFNMTYKFIVQGVHTTSIRKYNDTMNFNIRVSSGSTILRGFSVSDIAGALGDGGQNYKSLVYLFDAINITRSAIVTVYGCPKASSA